jgi:1-acyl-sn-glycerol-3-phosphate acyltransferase
MALLWSLIYIDPLIILSTIVFGVISLVLSIGDRRGHRTIKIARAWAWSLLRIARVHVKVEGLNNIDPQGTCVLVANHLSYMDTPVMLTYIPADFRFMAKKGLFQIPFLGTHLKQAGHIPVPLEDPRASLRTLTRAAETIREGGISVLIFPEGGRSEDGVLQPFKEGAAYLAIKAGVPLVPVALIGTREILAMHSATFHSGPVTLRFGQPIPTKGLTLHDRDTVTEQVRSEIAQMLERA